MAKKRAGISSASKGKEASSTPAGAALPAGFQSLPHFVAFALFTLLLFAASYVFSGFWPSSYEYWPQALFLALVACICLLLALETRPATPSADNPQSKIQNPKSKIPWLLAAFAFWCALSLLGTVYLHDLLLELSRVLGVVACFFAARTLLAPPEYFARRAIWFIAAIAAGTVAVCVPAIWDFAVTRNPRQFGTFYNPNLFANYCAMALPLTAGGVLLWRQYAREKTALIVTVGLAALAIIALGLIVTSSKGGLLAAFGGGVVFIAALFRAKGERIKRVLRARKSGFAIAGLLLLFIGGVLFSQTVLPRLTTNLEDDHSTMFRVYTWAGTWRMAVAQPLTGWGAGSFPSAYTQFAETGYTRSAHQSWLQIAAENGFPAMLLLLAACGFAFARGTKMLQTISWPIAAGSMGALVAFAVHGLTDSGWNIISIAVVLMTIMAILDCGLRIADCDSAHSSFVTRHSSLNWPWLLVATILALGSWLTQRAQTGEDLRAESRELMTRGARSTALERAREATAINSLSARLWTNLAQTQEANRENPWTSYSRAIRQQPTRALNYLGRSQAAVQQRSAEAALQDFDKAVQFDPNDPQIRIARANWLLEKGNVNGWQDLEYIAALADRPYGKYPATPEMVDLNFVHAYVKLAERDLNQGQAAGAQKYIARGLQDIALAQKYEEQRRAMEIAVRGVADEQRVREIDELESQLKSLQEKLPPAQAGAF